MGYHHLWLLDHHDNIDCHNWDFKIILLRGLVGREKLTLMIGAKSDASLFFFLRVLHHGSVSLASRLRRASDLSAALPPKSCGFSPMFMCIISFLITAWW